MKWYGTDKPDTRNPIKMQDVSEHFRDGGFGLFNKILGADAKNAVWAIPAPDRRQPRLLRPHELLGAGRGPAGPRLHLLVATTRAPGAARSPRTSGRSRPTALMTALGLGKGDAAFFAAGDSVGLRQVRRPGPHQRGPRS